MTKQKTRSSRAIAPRRASMLKTALIAAAGLIAAPVHAATFGAELVTNGGFEADTNTTTPAGWTFQAAASGAQAGATLGPAYSGNNVYFFGNTLAFDTLSQMIPTVAGKIYRVEAWLAIDNFVDLPGPPQNSIDGEFNHNTFLFAQAAPNFPFDPFHPNAAYQLMGLDMMATGSSTLLQFMGASPSGNVYIDDVSVREVLPGGIPEPASWALMILGFGGIGAMLRRARRGPMAAALST
jgi:hypothetical protein